MMQQLDDLRFAIRTIILDNGLTPAYL